ncbi:uncharacterized protein LOC144744294 [Ciona intestinalis]
MKTVRTNSYLTSDGNKMNKPSLLFLLLLVFFLSVRCVCHAVVFTFLDNRLGETRAKPKAQYDLKESRPVEQPIKENVDDIRLRGSLSHQSMCALLTEKSIQS